MVTQTNSGSDGVEAPASVEIKNIGGIEETRLTLAPGVNVFEGRNATNRTSFLSALGSVLGGTTGAIKSDAEEGSITLELEEEKYVQQYVQTEDGVRVSGTPYSDQEELIDLCVILLENNPARQAVNRGDDLRDVIMRPVDTEAIKAEIATLKQRRKSVEDEINRVATRRAKLPEIQEKRDEIDDEITELNQQLENLQAEVAEYEADLQVAEEASELVATLNEKRQELTELRDKIEVKQAERDSLESELTDLRKELDDLPDDSARQQEHIEENLTELRSKKHKLIDEIASLSTIIEFNSELLEEDSSIEGIDPDTTDVTLGLAPEAEQEVVCWTCGNQIQQEDIAERLESLRNILEEKRQAQESLQDEIDELQNDKQELAELSTRRSQLDRRITNVQGKITAHEQTVQELRANQAALEDEITEREQEVADTEGYRDTDLLDRYERISQLQYERGQLQQQYDDLMEEIQEIKSLPTKETLVEQREELQEALDQEKAKITKLEREAVEAFNTHMNELLEILGYENLARVWIDRKTNDDTRYARDGETEFDLHIVRENEAGAGYEDTVTNLSESEREVVGLVVALSSYLVFDLHEEVPFILLDSLEAIDADRIAKLIRYFESLIPYLIIALLPEDATALDEAHRRVSAEELTI